MKTAFGPFVFDRAHQLLAREGQEIPLPPRVIGVLDVLTARPGQIVSKQELIETVWKDAFVSDTSLSEAVSFLRQALGDDPQTPTYIQTVHRRGYRFVAPVGEPRAASAMELDQAQTTPTPKTPPPGRGSLVPWSVAFVCALLAASALWQVMRRQPPNPPVVRMRVEPLAGTLFDARAPALAIAPDGSMIGWSGCDAAACRLYIRRLDRLAPEPVAGTEDASAPFFSPDGASIGFFAGGKLKKVSLAGGGPTALADAPQTFGGTWLPDGRIVFAASAFGGLLQVADRGGTPAPLTQPSAEAGEIRHAWPASIGAGSLVFTVVTSPLEDAPGRIAVMSAERGSAQGPWRTLVDPADAAQAIGHTYIAFSRGGELHAVPFDAARLVTAGVEQVLQTAVAPLQFAVSEQGALVYAAGNPDLQPSLEGLPVSTAGLASLRMPALSVQGHHLTGVVGETSSSDIWVADVSRGTMTRLTHGGLNVSPVWSADGSTVFFASAKSHGFGVSTRDASAAGPEHRLLEPPQGRHTFPTSASRDGRLLAYVESGGPTRADIWTLQTAGGTPTPAVQTPYDDVNGMLSDDGRLLAYQSDESGRWQISLMRLADKHRIAVSTAGGTHPFWSSGGRSLQYMSGAELLAVDVNPDGTTGVPRVVRTFSGEPVGMLADHLVVRHPGEIRPREAVLTLEWIRELRQRLGPPSGPLPR